METLSWVQYILESGICMLVFSLFYYLVLSRETYFQVNRFYLLVTPFLALVIPALSIEVYSASIPAPFEPFYEILVGAKILNYQLLKDLVLTTAQTVPFSISSIVMLVYPLGIIWMSVKLIWKLIKVLYLIFTGSKEQKGDYVLVETIQPTATASFFQYLLWNPGESEEENEYILRHELAHIRQGHSLDNLLMELYLIFQWFNPLIYWQKKELRMTHEFIADQAATGYNPSLYTYAKLLVKHSRNKIKNSLMHHFAKGMLKERLLMLSICSDRKKSMLKYFLIIPVLMSLVFLFSCNMINSESAHQLHKLIPSN